MNELLRKQLELQKKINPCINPISTGPLCMEIRNMSFYLNQEIVELIEEIAQTRDVYKPWKKNYFKVHKSGLKITDKVKSEAIDVLKFTLNICLLAGITPENLDEEFDKVHEINIKRYEDGY